MSTKPTPEFVSKWRQLAKAIEEHDKEIAELRDYVNQLRSMETRRANLVIELENSIKVVDLAEGNQGWEKRIAWVIQELAKAPPEAP